MKKVALIAIAKDEDAYLHEWIHHHLYLGFGPIFIGLNRSTDQSQEILQRICSKEKQVQFFNMDWVDQVSVGLNPHIQKIAYSYLASKIDKSQIDYIGFLDIDEFWFNVEGKNIQNFISKYDPFDLASFNWLCQFGEVGEFMPPFKEVYFKQDKHVKSIINSRCLSKVESFNPHVPLINEKEYKNLIHIDQKGQIISNVNPQRKYNSEFPIKNLETVDSGILHRMMRSEKEYLALILRGRPNGELIKSNGRNGFKRAEHKLPNIYNSSYYESLNQFIKTHDLITVLQNCRENKIQSFKIKIERMTEQQLIAEMKNAQMALSNTLGMDVFANVFHRKVKNKKALKEFKNFFKDTSLTRPDLTPIKTNRIIKQIKKKFKRTTV